MAPSIGFIGYGRFGRALAALAHEAGMRVSAYDPLSLPPRNVRAPTLAALAERSQVVVFAVPVVALRSALAQARPHLGPRNLVIDVGSVKLATTGALSESLGADVPWAATHPLFGPTSLANAERPLRAIVCPNDLHPKAAARAASLYRRLGVDVLEQSADAHDRAMAETHALAFFVAKGMIASGSDVGNPFSPPSAHAIGRIVESVRADAEHLFETIEIANPYAAVARARLLKALASVDRDLASPDRSQEPGPVLPPAEGGSTPHFDLKETRRSIDQVDRELVGLLARRSLLVHRVAHAKARLDLGVRDRARETALLRSRLRWARELSTDPESVEDVFLAILQASRRQQRRGSKPRRRARP